MSGFVYVWYDRKHKRFYVGSHWGSPDDGYVCSSTWMKQAYRHRPYDFKRRIIARVDTTRADLLIEEERWLHMIKDEELKGKRYYNLKKNAAHWSADPDNLKTVKEKLRAAWTPQRKKEQSKRCKGVPIPNELRTRISRSLQGRKLSYERTMETRTKLSESNKQTWNSQTPAQLEARKQKLREAWNRRRMN